ncbi:unnamed protein product [Meloidogyne enterolobii]|uniref:Uncharacterized protein n=1 Tax=Meloidogyne enterolobii TaxID=390850 RepID=A0ACB0Z1S2_MELEN
MFNVNNTKCSLCLYVESPNGQMIKLFNLDSICMVLGFSKRKNFNDNPIIYYSF